MSHSGLHYRECGNEVRADMAFIVSDLTFPHISFAILFCQKKVKKIRKSAVWVFLKNTENRRDERHGKYASDLWRWFIGCGNMNLSSCKENAVTVYTVLRRRGTYRYSMIFHGQNLFPLYFCRTVHRLPNHNAPDTKLGIYSFSGNIYPAMLFRYYFNCTKWMNPLQRNNNDRQSHYRHCLTHKTLRHKIS